MNEQAIEQEIQAKGLTGPRITPADVEAEITGEHYHSPSDYTIGCGFNIGQFDHEKIKRHTICILTLRNGFTVVGVNEGPVSAANFDAELGRTLARQKAVDQVWPLMGYALKETLARLAKVKDELKCLQDEIKAEKSALLSLAIAEGKFYERFTFDQFVQYGRDNGGNIVNGMPWSFSFHGHPVTHENDRCYLIMGNPSGPGNDLRFTPADVLLVSKEGGLTIGRAEVSA